MTRKLTRPAFVGRNGAGKSAACLFDELVAAKREHRKPLLANLRRKVLERSEYEENSG